MEFTKIVCYALCLSPHPVTAFPNPLQPNIYSTVPLTVALYSADCKQTSVDVLVSPLSV